MVIYKLKIKLNNKRYKKLEIRFIETDNLIKHIKLKNLNSKKWPNKAFGCCISIPKKKKILILIKTINYKVLPYHLLHELYHATESLAYDNPDEENRALINGELSSIILSIVNEKLQIDNGYYYSSKNSIFHK